ncbi:MAG: ATP-dependent helicase HrpB [Leptospiraceae bacterium]|nr:ATP-dependent helicase HrpB [Leptospiraceae bacterium]
MELPVRRDIRKILDFLKENDLVLFKSPPGSGKTTVIPLELLKSEEFRGKIYLVEPRRIAAKNAALRISESLGERVGGKVGYIVRQESQVSKHTRLEVISDGILTNRLVKDPFLEGVSIVILDEFHERSVQNDLNFSLLYQTKKIFSDLKIILLSATIDEENLKRNLPDLKSLAIDSPVYPVQTIYNRFEESFSIESVSRKILEAIDCSGDILVFLPGKYEIFQVKEHLERKNISIDIQTLFGDMDLGSQRKVVLKENSSKRIILSTNIAESSLTIEGIGVVIDSGLRRKSVFHFGNGMQRLETVFIASDSADQRRGRAGRLGPGVCFRMWTEVQNTNLSKTTDPEILSTDLSSFCLRVLQYGCKIDELHFLTPPPDQGLENAFRLLADLSLVDANRNLTERGKSILELPFHPRLASLISFAIEINQFSLGILISVLLTETDVFIGSPNRNWNFFSRVEAIIQKRAPDHHPGSSLQFRRVIQLIHSYTEELPDRVSPEMISSLLCFAYPDRIGRRRKNGDGNYKLSNGKGVYLEPILGHFPDEEFIIALDMDGDQTKSKIYLACPLSEDILMKNLGNRLTVKVNFDFSSGDKFKKEIKNCLGELIVSEKKDLNFTDEEIYPSLIEFIKRNPGLLSLEEEALNSFLSRSKFLKNCNTEFPFHDIESIFREDEIYLKPYLLGLRSLSELKKIPVLKILKSLYSREETNQFEKEAPELFKVPNGSKKKIQYSEREAKVSLKVQEAFGIHKNIFLGFGKKKLLFELLSPAMRPIQITDDIENFWKKSYLEIRKELRGRYPKHNWPENP